MIAAIVILSLISLLVATDPEPSGSSVPTQEPPQRPEKSRPQPKPEPADRLAA